ncbi:hypothetical protein ARNL5_03164, partial [Anaerolineae bacterium]
YLLRVLRVPARAILVLCFNRNAVSELKRRLIALVGDDAKGVMVQTYHGLSLRLTGQALDYRRDNNIDFSALIRQATQLLTGETDVLGLETDDIRDRLLAGYRYILVDEYQDIDQEQYELISALTGRTLNEENNKLTILAVGDDDQNIYAFRKTSVKFIQQFQHDYNAKEHYLVENYRSSQHIISAANALISHNQQRMKTKQPIRIDKHRKQQAAGGRWQQLDDLVKGRVQKLHCTEQQQAFAVLDELLRLQRLDSDFVWTDCAVLAKEWRSLDAVRALLEQHAIPVSIALKDKKIPLTRVREIAEFLQQLTEQPARSANDYLDDLTKQHGELEQNPWLALLKHGLTLWQQETSDLVMPSDDTREFFYELLHETKQNCRLGQGIFLSTMHSAKGMEFKHVIILDNLWNKDEREEQRRLLYVAMTRAKETLCLLDCTLPHSFLPELNGDFILERNTAQTSQTLKPLHYALLGLDDLNIGYAAKFEKSHLIHHTLKQLKTGDTLNITA